MSRNIDKPKFLNISGQHSGWSSILSWRIRTILSSGWTMSGYFWIIDVTKRIGWRIYRFLSFRRSCLWISSATPKEWRIIPSTLWGSCEKDGCLDIHPWRLFTSIIRWSMRGLSQWVVLFKKIILKSKYSKYIYYIVNIKLYFDTMIIFVLPLIAFCI